MEGWIPKRCDATDLYLPTLLLRRWRKLEIAFPKGIQLIIPKNEVNMLIGAAGPTINKQTSASIRLQSFSRILQVLATSEEISVSLIRKSCSTCLRFHIQNAWVFIVFSLSILCYESRFRQPQVCAQSARNPLLLLAPGKTQE